MATGKRFYWFKISKDFMDSDAVNYLMGLKNGADYMMLYVSLCMMAVNTSGELAMMIGDQVIPYDLERIRRDAKWFSAATIYKGIELFKKLGLLYLGDQGQCILANYANMVGSETDYADKQRRQRGRQQEGQHGVHDGYKGGYKSGYNVSRNVSENVSIETEKETEIELETEIEQDTEQERERYTGAGGGRAYAREERPDFGTLEVYAANNLRNLSPRNCEELVSFRDDLPDDLIRHAIDEACAAGTPTWSYTRAILNRYVDSGFKTVGDAKAAEQKRRENRAKRGQTADGKPNPALDYEQHEHTESDFADLFLNLDDWEGGGTS